MLLESMAQTLQLPVPLIMGIARKADHSYKTYDIPKRWGGWRQIHHPSKELKAVQRWLLKNVILNWPVHYAVFSYRQGIGIGDHACRHRASRFILRMDLQNFFPSIERRDIEAYLEARPVGTEAWEEYDVQLFLQVVCRNSRLTIGAPTSPALSNALCYEMDCRLDGMAIAEESVYTRYADDLFFSSLLPNVLGSFPERVQEILVALEYPSLTINRLKTRHASKKGRRQVTGIVLSSDGKISLGRARKRFIRRQIHRLEELSVDERRELAGLMAFAISIEPDVLNAWVLKYGRDRTEAAKRAPT